MELKKVNRSETDLSKLDTGLYEDEISNLILVDKQKFIWYLCIKDEFPFEIFKNEEKEEEEKKTTDKTVSEDFALKMVAIATGKVKELDLNK